MFHAKPQLFEIHRLRRYCSFALSESEDNHEGFIGEAGILNFRDARNTILRQKEENYKKNIIKIDSNAMKFNDYTKMI